MVVDSYFDAVKVAAAALAKGAGAPQQHPAAMAQFAIKRLDHPRALLAHDVGSGGQDLRVGPPGVGKVARVAAIAP